MIKRFSTRPAAFIAGNILITAMLVGVLTGCGDGTPAPAAASTPAPPAASSPTTEFNGTDAAWLQLVLAMNERILPVLELGERRAADPAARRLAADVRAGHAAEAARLRELVAAAGLPADNPHETHDMPGMPTAATLDALRRARGAQFDRLFAGALLAHLDQLVRLAEGERNAGASPRARELAGAVQRSGEAHRTRLAALDRRGAG